jgi:hypothetical protein
MQLETETPIVGYQLNFPGGPMPPEPYGGLYNYALAGNGVFLRASRPGLEVCIPIADCEVRGLFPLEARVTLSYPRVPAAYVRKMLDLSISACVEYGSPIERLFHLRSQEDGFAVDGRRWRLDQPTQQATATSVRPTDDAPDSSYDLALIEVHSHHQMEAFFSGADDEDEQGFRIYGVLGDIFTKPKMRVRVGCYGHFLEVPAETIFEMPDGIEDANVETR